jgi:hypothetical protein
MGFIKKKVLDIMETWKWQCTHCILVRVSIVMVINYYFDLLVTLQDYGDSVDLDGFDIDYGVRIFFG